MGTTEVMTAQRARKIASQMMGISQKALHPNALKTVANVSKRIGTSGEVFYESFAAWLYDDQQRELSFDEVFAALDRMNSEVTES